MSRLSFDADASLPGLDIWWVNDAGSLIDFSDPAWVFAVKIGPRGGASAINKTTGITGAVGSGSEPDGTPNLTVDFDPSELNIAPGVYRLSISATDSGTDRVRKLNTDIVINSYFDATYDGGTGGAIDGGAP